MPITVDTEQTTDIRVAVLVNRTDREQEFWFDGRPMVFKAGESKGVLAGVADWLFRHDQQRCWTATECCEFIFNGTCQHGKPSQWVFRFGIKEGPEDLLSALSPDAFETDPIKEAKVVEGWETTAADRGGLRFRVEEVRVPKSDYVRQGSTFGHSMGAPAAVLKES